MFFLSARNNVTVFTTAHFYILLNNTFVLVRDVSEQLDCLDLFLFEVMFWLVRGREAARPNNAHPDAWPDITQPEAVTNFYNWSVHVDLRIF